MSKGYFTSIEEVQSVYSRRAAHYDISASLYYLLGFREWTYRRRAVDELNLAPGATILELGCGTGLNFALLQDEIGPDGKIIGVDLTAEMLVKAQERVESKGWRNVELIQSAAADYVIPRGLGGILSTFALTLEPRYDDVFAAAAKVLEGDARFALADLRIPEGGFSRWAPFLVPLVRPFAVSLEVAKRTPWLSMQRHLANFRYSEAYFGIAYFASGTGIPTGSGEEPDGTMPAAADPKGPAAQEAPS